MNASGKSRSTPTRSASSKSTGPTCRDSETSAPSTQQLSPTPNYGVEDSHASLSPSPASEALQMTSAIFGLRGSLSSPVAVLDGSSVRTSQDSFLPREEKHGGVSSVTWPRSGTLRNGRCYRLETSALRIVGRGFGSSPIYRTPIKSEPRIRPDRLEPIAGGELGRMNRHLDRETGRVCQIGLSQQIALRSWPTPRNCTAMAATITEEAIAKAAGRFPNLETVVALRTWPTPSGDDANNATRDSGQFQSSTRTVVSSAGAAPASPGAAIRQTLPKLWPTPAGIGGDTGQSSELGQAAKTRVWTTPQAQDSKQGSFAPSSKNRDLVSSEVAATLGADPKSHGQLNPDWVEWLMGYPIGFTACAASATR